MTTYYVSINTGSDNNSGRSASTPWKSLQKGLNALSPGDTLKIMGGRYTVPGDSSARDHWTLSVKGTSSSQVTVENYNSTEVILDGQDTQSGGGYPRPGSGGGGKTGLLDLQNCTYVTIKGLTVRNSRLVGVRVQGNETSNTRKASATQSDFSSHHVTLDSLRINTTSDRAVFVDNVWYHVVKDCQMTMASWRLGGGGANTLKCCRYAYWYRNVFFECPGDAFVADANFDETRWVYFCNNVIYDCEGPLLIHGVTYAIVAGNLIYTTPEDDSQRGSGFVGGNKGITIKGTECNKGPRDSRYIAVVGNVLINRASGLVVKDDYRRAQRGESKCSQQPSQVGGVYNCYFVGNTFYECGTNILWTTDKNNNNVIRNNISWNSNGSRHIKNDGTATGLSCDYNLYHGSTPSLPSGFSGAHDVTGNPQFENPGYIHKGNNFKTLYGGFKGTNELKSGYDDASGFRIKSASPAKNAGTSVSTSGWSDLATYINWAFWFTDLADKTDEEEAPNSQPVRSGTWDIGADEYPSADSITANFTATPASGTAPLTVSFRDRSSSTRPITSRFWDFGDGVISLEQNPVHEYRAGQYTVSLRVESESGSDVVTKTDLITVSPGESITPDRVTQGLAVLYRFDEGSGDTVYDVSGAAAPMDLRIIDPSDVRWLAQGLEITRPTVLVSSGPAQQINDACRESNEITIEAWIKPRNVDQSGPARIVSISKNTHSRNVTLGQGLWGILPSDLFDMRLRTTERSANGMPSFASPSGTARPAKTHVVFTRQRNGTARVTIDQVTVAETTIPGDFSTWNARFPLLIANETTGEFPWLGELYLIAIYDRALSANEIKQNHAAGTEITARQTATAINLTSSFRRFVLVRSENGLSVNGQGSRVLAYGTEYPDQRCVLCANGQSKSSGMAIYPDISAIIRAYGKQGLKVEWLD